MNWRSLGCRLSCFFSALLLAGLVSLSAALWLGVEYNMMAAVDELLEARASGFASYAESEFGNVFVESRTDPNKGEYRGQIEQVDRDGHWVSLRGVRIRLTDRTKFDGSLRAQGLQPGQFGEVEVERASAGSDWEATTVAVVGDLVKEMKEAFGEYALNAPDGHLIRFRNQAGDAILPVRAESLPSVSWQNTRAGFVNVATASGAAYRCLRREISLPSGTYRLEMASSLAAVSATKAGLLRWAWWILPFLILVSLAGGYLFSRAALLPLEDFSAVANRITAQRLTERLEVRRTGDVLERLARTFNSMLDRLESSVKRLDEFTADASHELRGPVAVIRTTAELALRQDPTGENFQRDLCEIHAEAVRLSGVIDDLLTLARPDSSLDQPLSPVDLGPMVTEVAERFCRQAGPRVAANTGGGTLVVRGHEPSLRRLVMIMVDNALRHNPNDTDVTISVAEADDRVVLTVADSGQGIAAADLPRLFDRFYRVDPARNRSSGAGLGLAIAHRIVQAHGGQITPSSEVGAGSVFRVSLQPYAVDRHSI